MILCSVIVIHLICNVSSSFSKFIEFYDLWFLLTIINPVPMYRTGCWQHSNAFFLPFDLILTVYDVRQISFLSFSKWQVALNSSLSFALKSSDRIASLLFCNVPTNFLSQAKSWFKSHLCIDGL